jgi:hypothetical protein
VHAISESPSASDAQTTLGGRAGILALLTDGDCLQLGLLYYSIMFVVVIYVLAFSLWWERGYQVLSSMSGVVVCKIKGSATATGKDVPLIYQGKGT